MHCQVEPPGLHVEAHVRQHLPSQKLLLLDGVFLVEYAPRRVLPGGGDLFD